jgi:methyl-accepting chemotaxis protein
MSIRAKLLLGFSAVIVMTVILAAQAIWTVKITGDLVTAVYDGPLMGVSESRAAAAAFQAARADILSGRLAAGASDSEKRLNDMVDDISSDIGIVHERIKSPSVDATLANVTRSLDAWRKARAAMLAPSPNGIAALPTPQAAERLSAAVAKDLDDLAEQAAARGYEMRSEADKTIKYTRLALLVVTALAAGLGVLLSIFTARGIAKPLGAMSHAMSDLAAGNHLIEIPGRDRKDEFAPMASAVQRFKDAAIAKQQLEMDASQAYGETERRLREVEEAHRAAGQAQALVVDALAEALERLARRDLLTRIEAEVSPDYQKLKDDFNAALEQVERAMQNVSLSTQAIEAKTQAVASSSNDLSRRTEQQAASLEEVAAALTDITETVKTTAEGAAHANKVASEASSDAETGRGVVRKAVVAMAGIEKSSQQIGQIIGVIDEIAFQTNLLALNAGVEAARAGEAGRGFAVVASEVRALAQRSATSAEEIKRLISTSKGEVKDGVDLVARTGEAFERIMAQVAEIYAIVSKITANSKEQSLRLSEVNAAVGQIDQTTQMNAGVAAESTNASIALAEETQQLAALVGAFKLGSADGQAATDGSGEGASAHQAGGVKRLVDQLKKADRPAARATARVA